MEGDVFEMVGDEPRGECGTMVCGVVGVAKGVNVEQDVVREIRVEGNRATTEEETGVAVKMEARET